MSAHKLEFARHTKTKAYPKMGLDNTEKQTKQRMHIDGITQTRDVRSKSKHSTKKQFRASTVKPLEKRSSLQTLHSLRVCPGIIENRA